MRKIPSVPRLLMLLLCGVCPLACDKEDDGTGVRTYIAPKDAPPAPPKAAALPISWTLPPTWTRLPDPPPNPFGSVAKIGVSADDPSFTLGINQIQSADVLSNLNRWEGQLGLPPTAEADVGKKVKEIAVETHPAHRIDLSGTDAKSKTPARMLAVILPDQGGSWSFLLKGAPNQVAAQEKAFDEFIASIRFTGHDHGPAESSPAASAPNQSPEQQQPQQTPQTDEREFTLKTFKLPSGWIQDPTPRDMRVATFYTSSGNDRGELRVSKFGVNRFGTMLFNVNRWRGEVGLPQTDDEHKENVREAKMAGETSIVFEFAGPGKAGVAARSLVAMVVKGRDMWFFKLIGPDKVVADQRANFDSFIQSVEFEASGNPQ